MNWISLIDWIHGETGGYLRYTTENRNWFEAAFPMFLDEASKRFQRICDLMHVPSKFLKRWRRVAFTVAIATPRMAARSAISPPIVSLKAPALLIGSGSIWSKVLSCLTPALPLVPRRSTFNGRASKQPFQAMLIC